MDLNEFFEKCKGVKDTHGVYKTKLFDNFKSWFESLRKGEDTYVENLQGMIDYGLSEEEAVFILGYTASSSSWVNSDLRNGLDPDSKCKELFIRHLSDSLNKIPPYGSKTVYRMDEGCHNDPKIELEWFESKIGSVFRIPYFLSTAKEDYENSEIVWQIVTHHLNSKGRDISNLSNNKFEMEVLFDRNAKFKIIDVDKNRNYVFLQEIDPMQPSKFDLIGLYIY